jgi:hypothetical protein
MKSNISQDASSTEHFSQNLCPPKIQNLENEGLGGNHFFLWGPESLASSILWFCNAFVTKKHVTLDVLGVPLSYLCEVTDHVRVWWEVIGDLTQI